MGDSRPMYQRIADHLQQQIDEGRFPVGARIPSRAELKRVYRASDQTVDRAVRVLKAAGYACGRFGRGVFVVDRAPLGVLVRSAEAVDSPFAARLAVADAGGGPDEPPRVVWDAVSTATVAPPRIATRLAVAPGERVMCTRYEYLADPHPLQLATSWEPLALTEGTDIVCPEQGPHARRGVPGRFAAIGIRVAHARERVASRPATGPEAETLGCSPGQCVTVVERTHYTVDGRPTETSDTVVRGDRWQLEYAFSFADRPEDTPWGRRDLKGTP